MGLISNGSTLFDSGSLDASVASGSMTHIKTLTASDSSTLSFVNGASSVVLDNTYKEYVFKFYDIHPSHSGTRFQFNGSVDTGSNYNATKQTSMFVAANIEADTDTSLSYQPGDDLGNSTGFQDLAGFGNANDDNDASLAGTLQLFDIANTTFVKHFIARTNYMTTGPYPVDTFTGGYFNTTSALDAFQFKFTSNNIAAGTIKLYGVK